MPRLTSFVYKEPRGGVIGHRVSCEVHRASSHFREGVTWEIPSSAVGAVQLQRGQAFVQNTASGQSVGRAGHIKDRMHRGPASLFRVP